MKFTVEGFNQELLVKLGLDNTDALILRWFIDFQGSGKMATVLADGKEYSWINYQSLIDDLPCMGITNKQTISRRLDRLVESKILTKYIKKDGGVFTCFGVGELYVGLVHQGMDSKVNRVDLKVEDLTQKSIGYGLKSQGGMDSKVETKDSSTNNSSTNNSSTNTVNSNSPDGAGETACNRQTELSQQVYSFWCKTMRVNRKAPSDLNKRITHYQSLGYSLADIKKMIIGCKHSSWHMGDNPSEKAYNGLNTILDLTKDKYSTFIGCYEEALCTKSWVQIPNKEPFLVNNGLIFSLGEDVKILEEDELERHLQQD